MSSLVITGILFIARARPRRAHGLRRPGEPRAGRLHGDRRLHRGDPGHRLRLVAAGGNRGRHARLARLRDRCCRSFTMRLRGHYLALATLAFGLLVDSLRSASPRSPAAPRAWSAFPPLRSGRWSSTRPTKMYYLLLALIVVAGAAAAGRHALRLRARAAGGAHRPDRGERARDQRGAPQDDRALRSAPRSPRFRAASTPSTFTSCRRRWSARRARSR